MTIMYAVGGALSTWGREELRYSIRSACMHLPVEKVVVVGDVPEWFTGDGIPYTDHEHHQKSIARKVLVAVESGAVQGEFLHMNDDFFLQGFDHRRRYSGLLGASVARMDAERNPSNWFLNSQRDVLNALREMGIDEPLNFATHTPFLMDADGAREAAEMAFDLPIGGDMMTLYWALNDVDIVHGPDAKSIPYGSDIYYSSAPKVEESPEFRAWLQEQFPHPSPFEK
jgi:hypothetical protein